MNAIFSQQARAQLQLVRYHPRGMSSWWIYVLIGVLGCALAAFLSRESLEFSIAAIAYAVLVGLYLRWYGFVLTLASCTGGAYGHLVPGLTEMQARLASVWFLGLGAYLLVLVLATFGPATCAWAVLLVSAYTLAPFQPLTSIAAIGLLLARTPVWKVLPQPVQLFLDGAGGIALAVAAVLATACVGLPLVLRNRGMDRGYAVQMPVDSISVAMNGTPLVGLNGIYNWLSRRAIKRRDAGGLVMLALGPNGHWGNSAMLGAATALTGFAIYHLVEWRHFSENNDGVGLVMQGAAAAILFSLGIQIQALLTSMYARRGEQALVRLAPLAPPRRDFNRVMSTQLLLRVFGGWLGLLCILLAFGWAVEAPAWAMWRAAAIACVSLVLMPTVVKDFAHMDQPKEFLIGIPLFLLLLAGILAVALAWKFALPLAVACGVLSLLHCWWRYYAIRHAPPMFPAGGGA